MGNEVKLKTCNINNRRYLGNKFKLTNFIRNTVMNNCTNIESVFDIFSGTGSVAAAFQDKIVFTNDLLYSNYITNVAWFSSENFDKDKIIKILMNYNSMNCSEDNYMTDNFSNTFFCYEDCSKIGVIRDDIEKKYLNNEINFREKAILITSLLYAMDRIANTVGHYDAYIRNAVLVKKLELSYPDVPQNNNTSNKCYNMDSNTLAASVYADLVYIDPPYNSRQYCDAYHLLENVARWEKPNVYGVARKMDRSTLKSLYCGKSAPLVFQDLIEKINARYILLSYNNMGVKGNDRSNARISDEDIIRILSLKGNVKVFSVDYKSFSTGKSNIKGNEERLFLCECSSWEEKND